ALHRKGRDRRAAGEGLDHHEAERVRPARKDEAIGRRVASRKFLAEKRAREMRVRIAPAEMFEAGAVADHHFRTGKIEIEERFDILFHRDPSDMKPDGTFEPEVVPPE